MSEHIEELVGELSEALVNREFTRVDELVTELEQAYKERQEDERQIVTETKQQYADSAEVEPEQTKARADLIIESSAAQFSRAGGLILATAVTEAHEELAAEGLLDDYIEAAQIHLDELVDAEQSFSDTWQTVEEINDVGNDEQADDETDSDSDSDNGNDGFGPGFGISSALAGFGGAGYLLKRRLEDSEPGEE